ncbi:efflux RND transporter permease subunit [Aquirufa aurantiipilula]|uniref:efflux RND transporter permease subunit n=1 Tax=Aquirufa aurantiipilula TaxID=2696561 RepID=UPI001CAA4B91|nr:MMPL family transporter [Aquirufa aurantiipilula]MBZ1325297.1 MMPL family transporter [Aquirufa aurantiipilula]
MKNAWDWIGSNILKHKIFILLVMTLLTAGLIYKASQIQLSYELAKILPKTDERFQLYEGFKKKYGEDGNVMVIGLENPQLFTPVEFDAWKNLSLEIKQLSGIKNILSLSNLPEVYIDSTDKKFKTRTIWDSNLATTQERLDTLKSKISRLPIFTNFLYTDDYKVHLLLITLDQRTINDKGRITLVKKIKQLGEDYRLKMKRDIHFSGMPFIRTEYTSQVTKELIFFLGLAILVTSLILLFFFRSIQVVFFALIVILIGILASLATIVFLGFKITLLSGLIPPLIVVIGIPNVIFLLNKYHETYIQTQDKLFSLKESASKVGRTLFLANLTTSIGFGVFSFTGSGLLVEFGIVASVNVMFTFLLSLLLIPIFFSFLAPPRPKDLAHFESKRVNLILIRIENWVLNHRKSIYGTVTILLMISVYGLLQIKAIGFIVDDLPRENAIYSDLKFIEKHFHGIIPFEISVDAKSPGKALSPEILSKMKRTEKLMAKYPEFTAGLSILTATKYLYQVYRGGDPKYFTLPGIDELNKLKDFQSSLSGKSNLFAGFIDQEKQHTRISYQMADAGTVRTKELYQILQPKIDSIFRTDAETGEILPKDNPNAYQADVTGNSVINSFNTEYLQKNLIESTITAIVLICLLMAFLFRSWKMVIISTLPSLIPLIITAGLMGYFNIALKPSTILIFSIAFGISSDGTIYFLTRYKEEWLKNQLNVKRAVQITIQKTGVSMFYTAMILFFGFFIFTASTFKGTQALGILVSITLLMAMICNLILLPAFLMGLNKKEIDTIIEEEI